MTGLYEGTNGWKTNIATGCKTCATDYDSLIRAKIRFVPWIGADFTLTGLYSQFDDANVMDTNNFQGNNAYNVLAQFGTTIPAYKPWTYSISPATFHGTQWSIGLHGDIDAGPGKISTLTYYESEPTNINTNASFLNSPNIDITIHGHPQDFSQELLYTTNQIGRFHAVVGAFYYNSMDTNFTRIPSAGIGLYSADRAKSFALFGEATFNVTDKLSITGGLRYTDETRYANALVFYPSFVVPPISQWHALGGFGWQHKTYNSWTSRIEALYKVTPHTNVYFTTSNGFTSGIWNETSYPFNFPGNNATGPASPETVSTYELGIKSSELPNLSLSAAGFYDDYSNLQIYYTQFLGASPVAHVLNAGKAKIYGVELNAQWHATPNLDFIAGATFLSATYSKITPNVILNANRQCPPTGSVDLGAGPIPVATCGFYGNKGANPGQSINGSNMIRTPPWSGNVTANYHRDFSVGRLDASATVYFSGKVYWYYGNTVPQSPYALLNGTIGFRPAGSNVHISVYGKNLTNAVVLSSASLSSNYTNVDYNPPRQYGVAIKYDF